MIESEEYYRGEFNANYAIYMHCHVDYAQKLFGIDTKPFLVSFILNDFPIALTIYDALLNNENFTVFFLNFISFFFFALIEKGITFFSSQICIIFI